MIRIILMILLITQFFSCNMKNNLKGHWKEVRSESVGINIGIPMPFLEFKFSPSGNVKLRKYDNPQSRFLIGEYILKDSLLILNPNQSDKFREYFIEDEFVVEKQTTDLLVLRTYTTTNRATIRYYFIPNDVFDELGPERIKTEYTHTKEDTIRQIEYDKQKEALKELQKDDRVLPAFPGGYEGLELYLANNLKYPDNHSKLKKIKISFEVDVNGEIMNTKVLTSANTPYATEAERVLKAMPNWLPTKFNGVPFKSNTDIVIEFKANN